MNHLHRVFIKYLKLAFNLFYPDFRLSTAATCRSSACRWGWKKHPVELHRRDRS
ncbi:MAG: hypothetical protein JXR73_19775 [Candidatus Omnitrophica bacterium]|nr:hypothetical protein [Candidatus Omnitrophota bacterium]